MDFNIESRIFWLRIFSHGFHGCTQIRRVWHPCHTHAATKLSSHRSFWQRRASHRIHRIHRIFWRKIFSHGFHGYTQIRRVWHPCHTHAAHQTIFPQKPQNLTQPNHLWTSVKSVGEYSPTVVSVGSANSVGGYARFAWLVHLRQVHPLGGWRGYGRMPYPPTKTPTDCTDVHRLGGKNAT